MSSKTKITWNRVLESEIRADIGLKADDDLKADDHIGKYKSKNGDKLSSSYYYQTKQVKE
jgi:hypothetical protein